MLNGGPMYRLTEAASIMVLCKNQAEIDKCWDALSDGGKALSCGWVTDKFGVTWQIVPDNLDEMLRDPDPEKANRVSKSCSPWKASWTRPRSKKPTEASNLPFKQRRPFTTSVIFVYFR
jgi:hypothetical protein